MKKSLLLSVAGLIAIGMSGCATYDGEGIFFDDYDYGPNYDATYVGPGYGYGHHHHHEGGGGHHSGGHSGGGHHR